MLAVFRRSLVTRKAWRTDVHLPRRLGDLLQNSSDGSAVRDVKDERDDLSALARSTLLVGRLRLGCDDVELRLPSRSDDEVGSRASEEDGGGCSDSTRGSGW